ncbi:MAG: PQQ-binding-like beta-propeller repeat protein [Candidatus Nealsonbacteria bacterium]|nr:PQQ-binding-like beta-propeller repeat protein [Candidatus Nealsonbacteria bacterium]
MRRVRRTPWLVLAVVGLLAADGSRSACAQFGPFGSGNRFELSEDVQLDEADGTVLGQLQRAKAHLADGQWDEAIETFRQVMEQSDGKLIGVTERRFVPLRDYGHLQIASMPAEALALYRSRVDSLAKKWYDAGATGRDQGPLLDVVRQAFASSWGDDALMLLGEMALESGDHAAARWYWQRIIPAEPPPDAPPTWPGYPDTDLDLAAVRARLVLARILEGPTARAREELTEFTRLHPGAKGRLGGPQVVYAEGLKKLLAQSATWAGKPPSADWPTFAGSFTRNRTDAPMIDVGKVAWRVPLRKITTTNPGDAVLPNDRKAVSAARLSYHPVVVGNLVFVNDHGRIMALDLQTGRPAWGQAEAAIYRDQLDRGADAFAHPPHTLGTPRFTSTVADGKLFVRMGGSVTSSPPAEPMFSSPFALQSGYLVCLDLAAEGRLHWKIKPEDGWAFEGSPVVDGPNVYVGMRRSDARPQAYVGCFDSRTGRRRWLRFICGAETPARGFLHQSTHNLLSLEGSTLYYNTNLGAVAAISARDGELKWVSLYPRSLRGSLTQLDPHWGRDLNPCLCDGDTLFVAPADSPRIFAVDAATGIILWETRPAEAVGDATYLLGTTEEHLIACGRKLYWIGLHGEDRGRVKHVWPDGAEKPGYGRGVIAGGSVLFPTREKIYLFDAKTARPKKVIDLAAHGASGGNLTVSGGRLLIATGDELIALDRHAGVVEQPGGADLGFGIGDWGLGIGRTGVRGQGAGLWFEPWLDDRLSTASLQDDSQPKILNPGPQSPIPSPQPPVPDPSPNPPLPNPISQIPYPKS